MASVDRPLVYIIVLTWNGREDTLECLESLRAVTYNNARILVVDNASTDGTAESILERYPGVEVLRCDRNLRYAGGNNAGIAQALRRGAQAIVLLNNDTVVEPDFVDKLFSVLMSSEGIGMVGPKIRYYSDRTVIWYAGGRIEWWKGWVSHRGIREIDRGQYDQREDTEYVTGCCCMVRRELVEAVGVLDEAYHIYGEDADWSIRSVRAGYRLVYEPGAVVYHKLSISTGGHLSWYKNWNKLRSQLRLMYRHARIYHWFTIPWMMVFGIARSWLRVGMKGVGR